MNQRTAIVGLVLAVALTGCSPAKVAAKELAAQLGTGSDDVTRWMTRNADVTGTSVDDTANAWKSRIRTAPRVAGIPKNYTTETACGALSSILFTDRGDDPLTVHEVLADLLAAMVPAGGTSYQTYTSLNSEVEGINLRLAEGKPVYLDLIVLRHTYCAAVLGP